MFFESQNPNPGLCPFWIVWLFLPFGTEFQVSSCFRWFFWIFPRSSASSTKSILHFSFSAVSSIAFKITMDEILNECGKFYTRSPLKTPIYSTDFFLIRRKFFWRFFLEFSNEILVQSNAGEGIRAPHGLCSSHKKTTFECNIFCSFRIGGQKDLGFCDLKYV